MILMVIAARMPEAGEKSVLQASMEAGVIGMVQAKVPSAQVVSREDITVGNRAGRRIALKAKTPTGGEMRTVVAFAIDGQNCLAICGIAPAENWSQGWKAFQSVCSSVKW